MTDFSLFEELLNLPRIRISHIEHFKDEILIWVYIPEGNHRYPRCGKYHQSHKSNRDKSLRLVYIW